ncbi:toll/interleukin-1 receptor domain-containing protein [Sphingomonas sp. NSE70-1]|uniref:Toll/interleukin-1 receptor domain-containing protein n=1 Tax=Sphingomonas caseinilyticus TaxID=2908205 RepID=A0ABT0RWD0_9SPHN|nr:toll/interleukin-1 receptor domain-containing protein [Sphingomonas caseinilyticus]MCL6699335.1 toll/interleukin-1 receptor domain-containing protein [Sphingomonas caseinilyticus]
MSGAQSTVILSYRREDSAGVTGRIFDRLTQEFGTDRVFMDIDSMPAGVDFHEHLQAILADCGALLVVVGKSWRSQRKGQPARIMDPDDWVRIEVETALDRGIPVVPLLIDGASLPTRDQLPESLWPLLRRNALPVDSGRDFHAQLTRLVRDLRIHIDPAASNGGDIADHTTLQQMTALPVQSVNWKALGRWILLLALIITLGAIAITGARQNAKFESEPKDLPEPPSPPGG